jgi:hypothetical protein
MQPLSSAIASAFVFLALYAKLETLFSCLSDALHLHTTPAWRVEVLYAVLVRAVVSATTVAVLLQMLGLLVQPLLRWIADRTRRRPPFAFHIVVYPRVKCANPTTLPQDHRCAVCLCEGTSNAVLECGHAFHWSCVRPWLDRKNTCPLCAKRQMRRGIDVDGQMVEEG